MFMKRVLSRIGIAAFSLLLAVAVAAAGETPKADGSPDAAAKEIAGLISGGAAALAKARAGDGDALDEAEEYLDRALKLAPDHPEILSLHGMMLTIKGREAMLPMMKMRHVNNGLKEMDRAVELDPMNFGIRYQRGACCLNLPDVFGRAGTAVEDFEHLLMMIEHAPESVPAERAAAVKLSLAQARINAGRADDARALLENFLAGEPDSSSAAAAKALLAGIDD